MSIRRTDIVEVDETFVALGNVTKTRVDATTGKRYIRGVASGVKEDGDGERVSSRAVRKMAAAGAAGVKITAGHDQDWLTEFGDVVKIGHDAETDELLVDCELPREGEDPIADKAWRSAHNRKLGFSIGGKLKKAYYELVEGPGGVAKRRKVLDEILLRHVALTAKPAYGDSFAVAVAKTLKGDAPAEDDAEVWKTLDLFDAEDDVAKAGDDDEPAPQGGDDAPEGTGAAAGPPAGTADETPAEGDAKADQEDAAQLPVARHLACPNCGHEFAAPLSADEPQNRTDDENGGDGAASKTASTAPDTRKDMAETTSPTDALAKIRELLDAAAPVAKTEAADDVAKTDAETEAAPAVGDDVAKTLAGAVVALDAKVAESMDTVAKALTGVIERIESLPQGRKSVARVLPPASEIEKTDDDTDVAKRVADAQTPLEALKAINAARGIA